MDERGISPYVKVVRMAAVIDIDAHRGLTAGDLVELAATLRIVQERLGGDRRLWQEKTYTAAAADLLERTAGAWAVRELRTASNGNAA